MKISPALPASPTAPVTARVTAAPSVPTSTSANSAVAPVPPLDELVALLPRMLTEPPVALGEMLARHGSVVRLTAEGLPMNVLVVNEPALIRDVLLDPDARLHKGRGLQTARQLLGNGLLTSEDEVHARHRRLVSPAFHRARLATYAATMAELSAIGWARLSTEQPLDIHAELVRIAVGIVGQTLFAVDLDAAAPVVRTALDDLLATFAARTPLGELLGETMSPEEDQRAASAQVTLDELVTGLISERRRTGEDHRDLLSMLVAAQDEDGSGLTEAEIRDELMTLLLAGHETTANLLAWTVLELARHPMAAASVAEEIARVTGGETVRFEHLEDLSFTEAVIDETLRLHPPAWATTREAPSGAAIGGHLIPAGGQVLVSPWIVHRDQRFWDRPLTWDPTRWEPGMAFERRREFTFVPFGAGARSCIGEHFARVEAKIVLVELVRRFHIEVLDPDSVVPVYSITLRPAAGIPAVLHPRT